MFRSLWQRMRAFTTIRRRLLVSFIGLVLLPTLAITVSSLITGYRKGKEEVFNKLNSVAALKAEEISSWSRTLQIDLLELSEEGVLHDVAVYLDPAQDLDTRQRAYAMLLERFFQIIELTKRFDELWVMSADGIVALSTNPVKVGEFRGLQPYFKKGLRSPGFHVQSIAFSSASEGVNQVIVTHPVKDARGREVGVVCGQANLGAVNALMGMRTGLGESGETYLVGPNNVLMSISRFPGFIPRMTAVFHRGSFEELMQRGDSQGLYRDYRGVPVIGVVLVLPELEMILFAEQDQAEAFRPIYAMLTINLSVAIGAILLASIAALVISRNISDPLEELALTASSIAMGDLDLTARVDRRDEIGALAAAFNRMTAKLRTTLEGLRSSEAKYRSIFENAVEGIFQATVEGKVVSANPAYARFLGYDSPEQLMDEVEDIASSHFIGPESRREVVRLVREEGKVSGYEVQLRRRNGELAWGEIHARPVYDQAGRLLYIEGILQDITDRKQAEEEKAALEEQLRQSHKMQAVGTLAGGIAHEFNNLLQAISGQVQLLLMHRQGDDKEKKSLQDIERVALRASDLVKRLLTFSRTSAIEPQEVDLNEVVANTVRLLERTIPKMVRIETDLADDLAVIQADASQMQQILLNLGSNAADAMPEGGTLRITTCNVTLKDEEADRLLDIGPGRYVELRVTDTGQGMDEEQRRQIFEPFFTTKEVGKGTGLGLSIVYGIVKSHHGHIHCISRLGEGTTFYMYFPAQYEAGKKSIVHPTEVEGEIAYGTETILIVDDEAMIRETLEEVLSDLGYTVLLAASGEQAIEVFKERQGQVDMVILDLGMPGIGGEQCLAELKASDPECKIIVSSGYAAHRISRNPSQFGAAAFLPKPYRLDSLAILVRQVLDGREH